MITSSKQRLKKTVKAAKNNRSAIQIQGFTDPNFQYIENLFCPYQNKWVIDDSPVCIAEKGRRVGLTYAEEARSVKDAILKGEDTTYTSYNHLVGKGFIKRCARFAKAYNYLYKKIFNFEIIDEQNITVFSITFLNGAVITAVPADPKNLRDRQGTIVIDEAAFRSDLPELLKAGNAITMRGGKVRIISTHNGVQNYFYKLCREIEADPEKGSHHHIPFAKAVEQGMYKSMCKVSGEEWTQEKELIWVKKIRKIYGEDAVEELDAVAKDYKGNQIFRRESFQWIADPIENFRLLPHVQYFDLACTSQEKVDATGKESYFTAYVTIVLRDNQIIILDSEAVRLDGAMADEWIEASIKNTPDSCISVLEQEGGSSGHQYLSYMEARIAKNTGKTIDRYHPSKSKMLRALPVIPLIKEREESEIQVLIHENLRTKQICSEEQANKLGILEPTFLDILIGFDGSKKHLVNDLTDCLSGSIDYTLNRMYNQF